MKTYSLNEPNTSIYLYSNYGPTFGGGHDLYISDNSNINNDSYSVFPGSYGKNEGAQKSELTKTYHFTVKRYQVFKLLTDKKF
jgi:hypothetical protein